MSSAEFLSHTDLALANTVCEIRYEPAYLIFDRTGAICVESREQYPDLKVLHATPNSTAFVANDCTYTIEQMASRINLLTLRHDPKELAEKTLHFFEIVLRLLDVRMLKRIGLRQAYFKSFSEPDGAKNVLRALTEQCASSDSYFGISGGSKELVLRWETKDYGTMFHVVALPENTVMPVPDIPQLEEDYAKKYQSVVVFDIDYYTIAPTYRAQWNSREWIAQSSHVIKKGIRDFLRQ